MRTLALATLSLFVSASAGAEEAALVPIADLKPAPWTQDLDREIERINRRYSGELAAYVSDPYRGYRYGFNAGKPFYLASGVKIAFMIGVFRAREHDGLQFDEKITFTERMLRDGGPRSNKIKIGTELSIHTLLDWMMRSSDNAASDILAERVGLQTINRGLVDEGLEGFTPLTYLIDVRRGIYRNLDVTADDLTPVEVRKIRWTRIWQPQINRLNDMLGVPRRTYGKDDLMRAYDRFYATGVNGAPMATIGLVFEKMLRKQLVSAEASEDMLALMTGARTSTHRLLGRLPRGTRVAHKTGSQFMRLCDLGVVFLPDGKPMIVTACTKDGTVPSSEAAIARIARKAYDLIIADRKKGS